MLKSIRGREHRHNTTQQILQDFPKGKQTLDKILAGELRGRLLCVDEPGQPERPTGLLVVVPDVDEDGVFAVEFFLLLDANAQEDSARKMLSWILESAEQQKGRTVTIRVEPDQLFVCNFLARNQFVETKDSSVLVRKLFVETPLSKGSSKKRRAPDSNRSDRPRERAKYARGPRDRSPKSQERRFGATPSQRRPTPQRAPLSVTLKMKYLEMIDDGVKTVEGRINSGMFQRLCAGQQIRFFCQERYVLCEVLHINRYPSFRQMLKEEGFKVCIPNARTLEDAVAAYDRIPGYNNRAAQYGVLGIGLKVLHSGREPNPKQSARL